MSKAIIASVATLCIGWWFTTYCVILGWAAYGLLVFFKAAAEGGAFN